MDATNVLSQLTDTWSKCLDQYYDHVAEEHMKVVSEKYNIPISDLMLKSKDLKIDIMKKLTNCMPENKKEPKKEQTKKEPKKIKKNDLESFGRKELHEMCKERNIPTKRKNADMVSAIKEYDLKNKPEPVVEAEEPEAEPVVEAEEPEAEPVIEAEEPEAEPVIEAEVEEELNIELNEMNLDNTLKEDEYLDEDDL